MAIRPTGNNKSNRSFGKDFDYSTSLERVTRIDLSEYPVGIYILQVRSAGLVNAQKLIVE